MSPCEPRRRESSSTWPRCSADDDTDPALPNVIGALAVLAGIAASDAICGHVLKQRPRGQGHDEAVGVLEGIREGKGLAVVLRRLLAEKDNAQYGTTRMIHKRAGDMVRRAQTLVDGMEKILRA